ncbi:hypothetical protein J2Z48_001602 [Croceifilum oryzae]|uniref:Uncharacterized protein n=1 Tax=Croceifilum oryzae TaxID=1553429 RepID=A0AAJ1TFF2_9BACL|nr:hypothetical protein [Croceifilum oryzae]MDQ0417429.1 hypothetical protein [Croceifilum oryzae]
MNISKRLSVGTIIILGLIAIGIMSALRESFWNVVGWIGFIGIIFYLYKKPPIWLQRISGHIPATSTKRKKKSHRFKVIDGSKKHRKF